MPTWSQILEELKDRQINGEDAPFDPVRKKYLALLHQQTGRNVILYATKWMQGDAPPGFVSIVEEDLCGLMEVIHGLKGPSLDLIMHSPGGSPGAAEALVSYLRSKFDNIRVVVPHMAMSAATMISCAADEIVMGKHSFLGPTDPQLMLPTGEGIRAVPAQAILEEFEQAIEECQDPKRIGAWLPKLSQYGPGLLVQCKNACELSALLVEQWLKTYMFKGEADGATKAKTIAEWLANHAEFKTHSRPLPRDVLLSKGLKIRPLEETQEEQDAFLSVFHATMHTFNGTSAVKIIENHLGKAYLKQVRAMQMPMMLPIQMPPGQPPPGQPMPGAPVPGEQPSPKPEKGKTKKAGAKSGSPKKAARKR
jgi:hypothetical protein